MLSVGQEVTSLGVAKKGRDHCRGKMWVWSLRACLRGVARGCPQGHGQWVMANRSRPMGHGQWVMTVLNVGQEVMSLGVAEKGRDHCRGKMWVWSLRVCLRGVARGVPPGFMPSESRPR